LSDIWQPLPFLLVCLLLPASFLILRKNYQEPASPNVAGGKARITPLSTLGKNELAALGLRIFGTTCIYTANALIQMYFTSYAFNRLGLDSRQASYLYSLNFVVMVAVAIPASRLSRRLGLLTIIMGGALLAAATHLVLFLLPGLPSFFLVIIAGGAGMTAVLSQTSPFIANSVPDPQFLGRYISLEGFFGAIGVSIAPAIAGLVIDATGDFGYVWMLTASLLAAAALALSFDSKFRRNLEKL
jgi:MFS family permease